MGVWSLNLYSYTPLSQILPENSSKYNSTTRGRKKWFGSQTLLEFSTKSAYHMSQITRNIVRNPPHPPYHKLQESKDWKNLWKMKIQERLKFLPPPPPLSRATLLAIFKSGSLGYSHLIYEGDILLYVITPLQNHLAQPLYILLLL